jgi:hypothetical protein
LQERLMLLTREKLGDARFEVCGPGLVRLTLRLGSCLEPVELQPFGVKGVCLLCHRVGDPGGRALRDAVVDQLLMNCSDLREEIVVGALVAGLPLLVDAGVDLRLLWFLSLLCWFRCLLAAFLALLRLDVGFVLGIEGSVVKYCWCSVYGFGLARVPNRRGFDNRLYGLLCLNWGFEGRSLGDRFRDQKKNLEAELVRFEAVCAWRPQ